MNRIICISGFILFVATTAKAQLIVNDCSPHGYSNLSGQRLSSAPARGLYIQNGKKVLK